MLNSRLKPPVAAIFALCLLCGCASFDSRTSAAKLVYDANDKSMSVVILSVGAAEHCFSFVTRLKLLPAGAGYGEPARAELPVDSYVVKSEYADHHGYLHVVRLMPGSYYFTPFISNPSVHMQRAPRADFTVSAGEVVYLGEYYLQRACGLSISGTFNDRFERDLALLRSKNQALAGARIQKRILRVTGQATL